MKITAKYLILFFVILAACSSTKDKDTDVEEEKRKKPKIGIINEDEPFTPPDSVDLSKIKMDYTLYFDRNHISLKTKHQDTLYLISRYLITDPTKAVKITGHTDNSGKIKHQLDIAMQRAGKAVAFLLKYDIERDRIFDTGKANFEPKFDDNSSDAIKNNRIEIEIINRK